MQDEKLKAFLADTQMRASETRAEFMTQQGLVFPVPTVPFKQLARDLDPTLLVTLLAIGVKYGKGEHGTPLLSLDRNPGLQTLDLIKLGAAILAKSTGG